MEIVEGICLKEKGREYNEKRVAMRILRYNIGEVTLLVGLFLVAQLLNYLLGGRSHWAVNYTGTKKF